MNRLFPKSTIARALALAVVLAAGGAAANSVLHEEKSLYSAIIVKKVGSTICLQFTVREDQRNQSCINSRRPKEMVFTYTRMSLAGLLFVDEPRNVLVVGLGGGTLPTAFHDLYPQATVHSVEIDPAVVRVAREHFGFVEDERMRVFTQDARVFTKRAMRRPTRYDVIVLDAFNGDYIPEHLMTKEYLEETKAILAPGGTLVANTFAISNLYHHESVTYQAVFGDMLSFRLFESGNRVIIVPGTERTDAELLERAQLLRKALKPYGVPIKRYARRLIKARDEEPDWDTEARVLTDQYSPANLLGSE